MKRFFLLFLLTAVVGCNSTTVVQDISQEQAREVVTTLYDRGIVAVANKESTGRGLYNVKVSNSKYAEASKILVESAVLTKQRESVSELIGAASIIPQSRELEALRVDRALAFEVEDLLLKIPAVQSVKSIVRQNTEKNLQQRGAAIVVTRRKGSVLNSDDLTRLVAETIPGIDPEKIKIEIVEGGSQVIPHKQAMVPFLWFAYVPEADYKNLAVFFLGCVIIVGIASLLAGYWVGVYRERSVKFSKQESLGLNKWGEQ